MRGIVVTDFMIYSISDTINTVKRLQRVTKSKKRQNMRLLFSNYKRLNYLTLSNELLSLRYKNKILKIVKLSQ